MEQSQPSPEQVDQALLEQREKIKKALELAQHELDAANDNPNFFGNLHGLRARVEELQGKLEALGPPPVPSPETVQATRDALEEAVSETDGIPPVTAEELITPDTFDLSPENPDR